jgi:hypothetical protein
MNFNFKESISKIKQAKIKNAIDEENSRLSKTFQTSFDESTYNFNKTVDNKKFNLIQNPMPLKKITPIVDSGNYVLSSIIKPAPDKHLEYIKNNVSTIVNVYQKEYNNFVKATGFGDFIRGTYFVIQFCERYKLNFDVQINHPFRKYLKLYLHVPDLDSEVESDLQVKFFDKPNFHPNGHPRANENEEIVDDFVNYLKEQTIELRAAYIYIISFNFAPITEEHRACMRSLLEPTDDFKYYILTTLKNMQLVLKNYIVIHIRTGDNLLIHNEEVNIEYLRCIVVEIFKIYKPQYKYLLLSDSVELKEKIVCLFPKIRAEFKEITHSGEGITLTDESVKNTMLDFYLMAYSGRIFAYSCYEHGSGFSRWCAETFNVPYKCEFVK